MAPKQHIRVYFCGNTGLRMQQYIADGFTLIHDEEHDTGVLWLFNHVNLFQRETVAAISIHAIARFTVRRG
jgi:hypothetical protein